MATTYSILAQGNPAAASLTILGAAVPALTSWVVSTLVVCNRASTSTSFRVQVRKSPDGSDNKQYLYYDVVIAGNDTFVATLGLTLGAADSIYVYATDANLSFNLFGSAIT